jgi:hypothetical protein
MHLEVGVAQHLSCMLTFGCIAQQGVAVCHTQHDDELQLSKRVCRIIQYTLALLYYMLARASEPAVGCTAAPTAGSAVSRAVADAFASGAGSNTVASAFASASSRAISGGQGEANATAIAEARALVEAAAINEVCRGILLANGTAIAEVRRPNSRCSAAEAQGGISYGAHSQLANLGTSRGSCTLWLPRGCY